MNKYMHPRNPYKKRVDFRELGEQFPEFGQIVDPTTGKVDFSVKSHAHILSKCLLKRDFDLDIEFPPNSISPSLTLKLNYLLWIQDILRHNNLDSGEVVGVDIGTGGAVLFPALAARHFGWSMIGTEVDDHDVSAGRINVQKNHLDEKIRIFKNPQKNDIFQPVSEENATFSMSNPPFFDASSGREDEEPAGRNHEIKTEGGEVEFVTKIILESRRTKIKVFTTMLGHKKSLGPLKAILASDPDVKEFISSEFCQGRVMRWALAWTFLGDIKLKGQKSTFKKEKAKKSLHDPFLIPLSNPEVYGMKNCIDLHNKIKEWVGDLEAEDFEVHSVNETELSTSYKLFKPSWRHQRRKRRMGCDGPPAKKVKVDEESSKELLLFVKMNAASDADKIVIEMCCESGSALGRGGLYELVQYFRNKLTSG